MGCLSSGNLKEREEVVISSIMIVKARRSGYPATKFSQAMKAGGASSSSGCKNRHRKTEHFQSKHYRALAP
jgi:hypothetical protein